MGPLHRALDTVLSVCERLYVVLANTCLAVMLLSNATNIASRAVLDQAISWVFPWTMVLFVWMVFLGFFIFVRRGRSIAVEFVLHRTTGLTTRILELFINAVILTVLGVILSTVPENLREQVGELEMVGLQRYALSIPLFVSCALICLHVIGDSLKILDNSKPRPETAGS